MRYNNFHISYSLNVFPGTSLSAKIDILKEFIPNLREEVNLSDTVPIAVGLWIDNITAVELLDQNNIEQLIALFKSLNIYTTSINAFPYSTFHNEPVKTKVYKPDWTTDERKEYTINVARILAQLLPPNQIGTISTLPGGYKAYLNNGDLYKIAYNITEVLTVLYDIYNNENKEIVLAIEPEPDCLWENSQEFISFYNDFFKDKALKDFLGICYDTCHFELQASAPGDELENFIRNGIKIAKVQLSAALKINTNSKRIENFIDKVYLHQSRIVNNNVVTKLNDLTDETISTLNNSKPQELIVHYHLPLYLDTMFNDKAALVLKEELVKTIRVLKSRNILSSLEIETYTYTTLNDLDKKADDYIGNITKEIAKEYRFVFEVLDLQ
jgi:sugar phosphate isomerase/epimerase